MADLNQFAVQGRLTSDAEYSTFGQKDTPKIKFSVANNIGFGDYKWANFFNCEMIGKGAAGLAQYMLKGKPVIVSGEIKQERWETQEGKRSTIKLLVRNVNFISEGKSEEGQNTHTVENVGGRKPSTVNDNPFAEVLKADNAVSPEEYVKKFPHQETYDDIPFGNF